MVEAWKLVEWVSYQEDGRHEQDRDTGDVDGNIDLKLRCVSLDAVRAYLRGALQLCCDDRRRTFDS